jgi:hypothetical protein
MQLDSQSLKIEFHNFKDKEERTTGMTNFKRWLMSALMFATATFATATSAPAQAHQNHQNESAQSQSEKDQAAVLLQTVREATERYKDFHVAEADGYHLAFGCVSGSDFGAMGMHFVNMDLVAKGELDPKKPQIILYEPTSDGKLKLTGADFLVDAAQWDAKKVGPPILMGQIFHFFEAPNRFGLNPFYTLHVWAWKENPNGAFVNWHPNVACQSFSGQNP